ncbi:MAG TPA: radical SAM protein, partial [Vicinamibacteria bacterium]
MRVALVGAELEENLSIRYLRSALEAAGHEAVQFAFNLPEELDATAERVVSSGAAVAGISIVFTRRAREFADLAVRLRERGFRGHLTAGGHFAAFNAENLLRDVPAFDSIAVGEGEAILYQLVEHTHQLASVEGLVWRDEHGEVHRNPTAPKPADLDTLPWPVRKLPYDRVLGIPIVNFLASRGCAYTCHFCSIAAWQGFTGGARLRMRSPEEVAREMSKLYEDGIRIFNFHDDNFLLGSAQASLRRLNRIQEELARRRVGRVALAIKARPDEVHYDVFARLKEMGLFRVFLGVEAGTSQALVQLGRGQEIEDNERALAIMRELDLHACFNLLLWNPDSTLEDVALNAEFLGRQTFHPLNFCRTEIYSGTPLESRLRQEGRLLGDYWGYDYVMRSPGAEESFVLAHRVFRERTHGATSLQHWAMMVDYHHQLLAHFGGSEWRLRRRVKRYVADVNRDTSRKLLTLMRAVERGTADEAFVRDLRTEVRERNGRWTAVAAKILDEIHDRAAEL